MKRILKTSMHIILIIIAAIILLQVVRLFLIKRSIVTFKNYWTAEAQKPAEQNARLYVALGDSAAQGIGATKPEKGYVGLIANALTKASGEPVHVVNLSVSGAKMDDLLKDQLPVLQTMNLPAGSVITVEIGANDMVTYQPEKFRSSMEKLMSQLPANTVISDIPYFGGSWARSREPNVVDANKIMYELADKYGFKLAPLHKIIQANSQFYTFGADFFHPSNRGYRNWYKAFAGELDL